MAELLPVQAFHAFWRRRADLWPRFLELAARAGYVARGFVYISIGAIALLAAVHATPEAEGAVGALKAWGKWPAGLVLLWLTGLGLYAFAGWRVLQSIFDADRQGHSPKALASRLGQAISGVLYGSLAIAVFGLLDAAEDLREIDDQAATTQAIGDLLAMPFGGLLVIGVGAFTLACGVGNIVRGMVERFHSDLDCDGGEARGYGLMAKIGYIARGVAFLPAGLFTLDAGLHARAAEAKGMGEALETFKDSAYGEPVLTALALGLIAFGLFAFVEARYRRIRPEAALS